VKNTPKSFRASQLELRTVIYDALAQLRFRSLTKQAKALPLDDHRREAFFARSKDKISTKILKGRPYNDIRITNREFHEVTAVMFGNPSSTEMNMSSHKSTKQTKSKQSIYTGDNAKTAAYVPIGFFVHVHEAMFNVVENDLQRAHIMLKRDIDTFSGAEKAIDLKYLLGMIINTQDGVTRIS
jgi:DNA-binding GntR family transcriptional regulator